MSDPEIFPHGEPPAAAQPAERDAEIQKALNDFYRKHPEALNVVAPTGELVRALDMGVIARAYGWTLDVDGQVHGLVAGDHGYEPTGIVIDDFKKYWREVAPAAALSPSEEPK